MKIRDKYHRLLIAGLSKQFTLPEKDVVYFFVEFAMGICIAHQKEKEDEKKYVMECVKIFLDKGHGALMSEELFKSWKAGGEAYERQKNNG